MSEQQGWAPNPADQQGRASGPAAQPTTTPADTTTTGTTPAATTPAATTPAATTPAATTPADAATPTTTPVTPPGTTPVTPTGSPAAAPVQPLSAAPITPLDSTPAAPLGSAPAAPLSASPLDSTPAAPLGSAPAAPLSASPLDSTPAAPLGSAPAAPLSASPLDSTPAAPLGSAPAATTPGGLAAASSADLSPATPAAAATPAYPALHAWPTNSAAPVTGAGDLQTEPARTWPAAQSSMPAAPVQTWPASQHAAPQAGNPHTAQGNPFTGQGGVHGTGLPAGHGNHLPGQGGFHAAPGGGPYAAQAAHGQPGTGQDPRAWAAASGAGHDQPHLPTAQLPPHVPHMQRPPHWAQQPQPGSVFVAPAVRRRSRVGLAVAGIVAAVGLSAVSAFGGGLAALELRPEKSNAVVSATDSSGSSAGATTTLSDVAAQVLPSVVSISTGNAVGSGVVITADGAILTNNHVVATARGTTVQVTFSNGQTAQAKIVGTEPTSDLAVIKIVGGDTYTPLAFGDSSTVKVGDTVLAVGSPLGLDGSVTAGIVSAVNRTIDEGDDGQSSAAKITGAIQTDAAINPGNSGGALVNTAGQLVGINTAIATSGETAGNIGVGFAISSNTAKTVAQRLLS
ncbi:trypsin-like peptidase domain-containing protein [Dactylosporangium sp. NBC_01737]|uniref:S1C family serine protease n=1 Tax=Dactylosporangium sp. NBC_01737 TaxID=2975959 RepID=UPI002E0DB75C|nr:trypsin-like peptidase domain-containing protein [Dactylosporangium sp. NBC_01737]